MSRDWLDSYRERIDRFLWKIDPVELPRSRAVTVRTGRIAAGVFRDLAGGQLGLQAMSLVYTTLLALVPLLAVSFSVLKAFGVHNQIEPLLRRFLAPLGPKGFELSSQIIEFVEEMRVGVLGSLGLVLLIWSVVALIQKIEAAFNDTWHIDTTSSLIHRITDYLSVILVGPVLIFSALGITASVMSTQLVTWLVAMEPLGTLVQVAGKLLPYLLVIAAFTFVYLFVPNTKVRLPSALLGALIAGIGWETLGWVFAHFIVTSARWASLYSGFAILLLFMFWLYLSWLVLLIGASIAFYHQHPEYQGIERRSLRLSGRMREKLALLVAYLVGGSFLNDAPPWTARGLAARLELPNEPVVRSCQILERAGLLVASTDPSEEIVYRPARSPAKILLAEVLEAVRADEEGPILEAGRLEGAAAVDRLEAALEGSRAEVLGSRTVEDLVREGEGASELSLSDAASGS